MTKKELAQKLRDFIQSQDDNVKDEWWGTDRKLYGNVIEELAKALKVKLPPPPEAQP